MRRMAVGAVALVLLGLLVGPVGASARVAFPTRLRTPAFADPGFAARWEADEAAAPGFWGEPITDGLFEPYTGAPGGIRLVQYYERGRLEMANGAITGTSLVLELYRGRIEIGLSRYDRRPPPDTPILGDMDGPNLTYAALTAALPESGAATPRHIGMSVTTVVAPSGAVSSTPPTPATGPESIGDYSIAHNVLQAFADYQQRFQGPGAAFKLGPAITEPFRTTVTASGVTREVIMQPFAQRVLVYDPTGPDDGRVTVASTGRAYYAWRYASGPAPQPATGPLPTAMLPDARPGMVTLTAGGATQTGKPGYASWCQADATGRVRTTFIADTFNFVVVPPDALPVTQGASLTFAYLGADPLRAISATFYPLASVGTPDASGTVMLPGKGGMDAPVTQSGGQVTIGTSLPPDDYLVVIRIVPDGAYTVSCAAEFQFHLQVQ